MIKLFNYILEREILKRILVLYGIIFIFAIVLIFSTTTKKPQPAIKSKPVEKPKTVITSKIDIVERPLGDKKRYKCPNCKKIFNVHKPKNKNVKSFIIYCPFCGLKGRKSNP